MEKEFEISRSVKIVLYCLAAPGLLIVMYFIISSMFGPGTQETIEKNDLSENFNGRVDSIYTEVQNHNTTFALLSNRYKYPIFGDWISNIQIGDSLSKTKGSFNVEVFKKNGRVIILDYRKTYIK